MRKKSLFVINPLSGKGQIRSKLLDIVDIFIAADFDVNIYVTQCNGDAFDVIEKRAGKYDLLISSGGDGTLSESVKALMHIAQEKRPSLGYIPAGTTNDFATTLEIPKDMIKAAQNIVEGVDFRCDVGSFNKDYFIYIAAFGAFTDVAYDTPQEMKNYFGHMAYIMEGIKRVGALKGYKMKMEYADAVLEDEFIYGMIANTKSVAGMPSLQKENVRLDDGVFEIILIKMPQTPAELQIVLTGIAMQDFSSDMFVSFKTDSVKFSCEKKVPWTLDGEFGGNSKEVTIKNNMRAISIIVNKDVVESEENKGASEG